MEEIIKLKTFNKNHPELLEGEMFVSNTSNREMTGVHWKTKRLGNTAYNIHGEKVSGLFPVFRDKNEKPSVF